MVITTGASWLSVRTRPAIASNDSRLSSSAGASRSAPSGSEMKRESSG